jgi:glycine hydroxymethyltransferase
MKCDVLKVVDEAVYDAIKKEIARERSTIVLIASENYISIAALEAQGSVFTNKYAEGYPGKRYYGGCEYADLVENLAQQRAKELFKAEHVNVQPHSGSQANMAVYFGFLNPDDTVLGMDLRHGGHLTHGSSVNFSGKLYKSVTYGVDKASGYIDYAEVEKIALTHKPRLIVAGASAYSRTIDFDAFSQIARKVNAYLMADIAHIAGLIAAGLHPSPVSYADFVTTSTHKTLRGPRGGMIMCKAEYAQVIDKTLFPGIQGGPLVHVIASKAVAFKEAQSEDFRNNQKQVIKNAQTLAKELTQKGFTIISGGTDNHLMLIDLTNKNITGKDAEAALERAGIILNKNSVPYDTKSPTITSGIRLGTPSVTTRGMKEKEMVIISDFISDVLNDMHNEKVIKRIKSDVQDLCAQFSIYDELL